MAGLPSPSTAIHPALASAGHLPLVIPMSSPNSNPIPNPDSPDRPRTSYNIRRADPTATERTEATSTETIEDEDNQRPHSAHAHFSLESIPRQTVLKALASSVARARKPEALSLAMLNDNEIRVEAKETEHLEHSETTEHSEHPAEHSPNTAVFQGHAHPSQQLCDALHDLALRSHTGNTLASLAALASPSALSPSALSTSALSTSAMPTTSPTMPTESAAASASASAAAAALSALQSPCYYHQRFDDAVDIDRVLEEIKNDQSMSHSRLVQTATGVREVSKQLQRRPIRRAVRNVMIVTKARDNELVLLTRELAQWLLTTPRYGRSDLGVNVYVDAKLRRSKRFGAADLVAADPTGRLAGMLRYWTPDLCWSQPEKFDLVITLGGDGTVLFTSWLFQRIVPPVLSFSLGSLGFLTTFEYARFRDHLDRVMGSDGMRVNLRMRFTCTVYRAQAQAQAQGLGQGQGQGAPTEGEQFEVLNELVIDRGPSPYVSNLELYGDDELLTVVQADGCIFSTPTGSTAYSLSAGGSLVHPDIPAILLTPICPHTLSFRPMVLSDTMLLRVTIPRNSRATAFCAFDGKGRLELRPGDSVTITASQYPFPTVTRTDTEWFDSVSRTLRWNTRAATQKGFDGRPASDTYSTSSDSLPSGLSDKNDDDWDIDTDSAYYASEEGSVSASPLRRQMSLLGM